MKKAFFAISAIAALLFIAACDSGNKVNPLWGLWIQKSVSGPKTEIMFNDDNTGFVFVADTVTYETKWIQDSLLIINYFEPSVERQGVGVLKSFRVSISGNTMKLKNAHTGEVTKYSRYVDK